jgi:hypothetical protein
MVFWCTLHISESQEFQKVPKKFWDLLRKLLEVMVFLSSPQSAPKSPKILKMAMTPHAVQMYIVLFRIQGILKSSKKVLGSLGEVVGSHGIPQLPTVRPEFPTFRSIQSFSVRVQLPSLHPLWRMEG